MPQTAEDSTSAKPQHDLRRRRRASMQRDLALGAVDLFERQGFAETTVEQIAAAAGISLRTFYRHCAVKEEALTPLLVEGVNTLVEVLAERPADEPLRDAAQAALLASSTSTSTGDLRRIARLMLGEPALKARWLAAGRRAQDLLTPVIAERLGPSADTLAASATAGMLVNVATTALEYWAGDPDSGTLADVTTSAYTAIANFNHPRVGARAADDRK
ncbi:TetR/AcrR family transcriptional regulator [Streptomyces sp. NBC_00286]|uniref:TetR/AcrR family transcriptional regulator n=1 Tax=Streptomyces sp. NBC_00286 TaxID=2975701 RepID=UPI002E28EA29|nr:TetR family transcriptional regulator [Streptomyces sp. NBC_00286]